MVHKWLLMSITMAYTRRIMDLYRPKPNATVPPPIIFDTISGWPIHTADGCSMGIGLISQHQSHNIWSVSAEYDNSVKTIYNWYPLNPTMAPTQYSVGNWGDLCIHLMNIRSTNRLTHANRELIFSELSAWPLHTTKGIFIQQSGWFLDTLNEYSVGNWADLSIHRMNICSTIRLTNWYTELIFGR
jgi:hypothetical protein